MEKIPISQIRHFYKIAANCADIETVGEVSDFVKRLQTLINY